MSDLFGDPFGGAINDAIFGKPPNKDKPLPAIRGKQFDGVLYVRATDVADALESQAPTVARRLIDKLRSAAGAA